MRAVCNGCGTRKEDWEQNPDAYIGNFEVCPGCERLEAERDNVSDGTLGVHYSLLPQEEALRRAESIGDAAPADLEAVK